MDPTSGIGEVDPEDAPRCETCNDPVVGDGQRVRTQVTDGAVHHRYFCDDDCLEDWDAGEAAD